MPSIATVRNMISHVIDSLGGDSYDMRIDKNSWRFVQGSARGWISIYEHSENEEYSIIQVRFLIMRVPLQHALAFYRRILSLNYDLFGHSSFALSDDNHVVLSSARIIRDLDISEIEDMVLRTSLLADRFDDQLLAEFGPEHSLWRQ